MAFAGDREDIYSMCLTGKYFRLMQDLTGF
jgi:hypothetical protein